MNKSQFLTAEWKKLAIANYAVDPDILKPYLPYKTELDIWNNQCYVSLVGFKFLNTKLKGFKIPFHSNFEEVNLRFYIRYKNNDGWKRGVTFIKEIVPKPALAFIANQIYKEKYITLPMKHQWDIKENEIKISYHWLHDKKWNDFSVTAHPTPMDIPVGSEEEFITEHYWGYTAINDFSSSEYQVEHPRWKTFKILNHRIDVDFCKLYGNSFECLNLQAPSSIMLAEGSEIAVLSARRIK